MLHSHYLIKGILLDFSFISEWGKDDFPPGTIFIEGLYADLKHMFEVQFYTIWLISNISLPGEYTINSGSN